MKRLYSSLGIALALIFSVQALGAGQQFGDRKYTIEVHDERSIGHSTAGKIEDSTVYVFVYSAGTRTLATIYSDTARTSKSNPITRSQFGTDDGIVFYGAASSYDILLAHSDGSIAKYTSVGPTTKRLMLPRSGSNKTLIFPMAASAGGSETDTGLDLPYGALVTDAYVEVVTTDATETVDMGLLSSETAGDADGFLNDVSVATAGIPARVAYTTGSNEVYLATFSYGALLGIASLGNDVATDVGSSSMLTHYVTGSNATSVTYTPSTSDTFAGYGYVIFRLGR